MEPHGAAPTSDDARFMRRALQLAREARSDGEVPVGAVVTLDGAVVGEGRNRPVALADPTAHAEVLALRDAAGRVDNYRLTGATLYCTVEPCLMCLGAALQARIGRVVFGAHDRRVRPVARLDEMRRGGAAFNHRFECSGGVLAEEAAALLLEFFRERRAVSGLDDPGDVAAERFGTGIEDDPAGGR